MPKVNGNRDGVRDTLLAEMEQLYTLDVPGDEFAPVDMVRQMAAWCARLNREISVYISRSGEVLDVTIGYLDNVPLAEMRLRRSLTRLSCVRCVHTHPGGSPYLSDVDLTAMRSLWLDAMAAVGVDENGRVTGVQVAFPDGLTGGMPAPRSLPPVALRDVDQAGWMQEIERADERVERAASLSPAADAPERALLAGIESQKSLDELRALAETAGAQVVGEMLQKRRTPDGATYLGAGKAEELRLNAQAAEADLIIVDDELTGAQTHGLEEAAGVRVVDRTTLILDIFAQRARSREGKLQVQLAQMRYQLSHLIGQGLVLSRLAGGIGTRGPGESKLEMDRRRIRERVWALENELNEVSEQRAVRRRSREKSGVPLVALVGYTNTGKSTLLNRVTGADVYVHDQLFATLDATSRRVRGEGGEYLLTDTVGFIRKLPHDLVNAFRSTLEEAALADVLVIVSDASSPDAQAQRNVVEAVLTELGACDQPRIDVLNKCDCTEQVPDWPGAICLSARTGEGMDGLMTAIDRALARREREITLNVPFSDYALVADLHQNAHILQEEHTETGTRLRARVDEKTYGRLAARFAAYIAPDNTKGNTPT